MEILDEAAGWLVEFRVGEVEAAQRREFNAWLRASPEHVRAYLALLPTWENSARLDPKKQPDKSTLISWARSGSDNVIPLEPAERTRSCSPPRVREKEPAARISFALAAAVIVMTVLGVWYTGQRDSHSTTTGEQRSIMLTDGSIVELNALSRVRIRFGEQERGVDLLEGQALFRVAHEKARPFIVRSGETKILAVGTQFDVYRKPSGTTVTVLEGRVAVLPPSFPRSSDDSETANGPLLATGEGGTRPRKGADFQGSAKRQGVHLTRAGGKGEALNAPLPVMGEGGTHPYWEDEALLQDSGAIFLVAGQQVNVTPAAVPRPTRANIAAATAWTQRRLIFSATPLTEVAEEFNRYNTRHLIIDDPGLETFRINGVFSSTNPAALLGFLHEQPGISVTEADQEIRVTRN